MKFATAWRVSGISQREKDKYCMISFTCRISKMQQTNTYNNKGTDSQRRNQWLPVGKQKGKGVREWQGTWRYKLLGIKK